MFGHWRLGFFGFTGFRSVHFQFYRGVEYPQKCKVKCAHSDVSGGGRP